MVSKRTADQRYWPNYTGIQHAKHAILASYLDAWYPIMSQHNNRLIYIDTHAGRGRHATGHAGSPLIAIERLLHHFRRDAILRQSDVMYILLESNAENMAALQDELADLSPLPSRMRVFPVHDDYETMMDGLLANAAAKHGHLYPMFAFVDPYSFCLSMAFLNRLLAQPKCELLITFMYRHASMAACHASQATNLDTLFGCGNWRDVSRVADPDDRANAFISLFGRQLHARWVTHLAMRDSHNVLKYFLIHAANHDLGRAKMKEAIWRAIPDGSFTAYQNDNPDQLLLLQPEPDLGYLKDNLWRHFAARSVRGADLDKWVLGELYLPTHLHKVMIDWRKAGVVLASDYGPRFAFARALFTFPSEQP